MSEFFESDESASSAELVQRHMRRQELHRAEARRLATWVVSLALAGTLVLGGGFAAFAASHPSTSKKVATATHAHAKTSKKVKKHKKA